MATTSTGEAPMPGSEEALERRWAALHARLMAAERWLRRQGTLTTKRAGNRRVWVVRFFVTADGRRRQKSIYVGTEDQTELVRRTRAVLARFRTEGQWSSEIAGLARLAGRASRLGRDLARGRWP